MPEKRRKRSAPIVSLVALALLLTYHGIAICRGYGNFLEASPDPSSDDFDDTARRLGRIGNVVRYLAGEAPPRVLVGRYSRWLWLDVGAAIALQFPAGASRLDAVLAPQLRDAVARLKKAGVEIVIVPVPTKLSVYRDTFPLLLPNFDAAPGTPMIGGEDPAAYRRLLSYAPEEAVDVLAAMKKQRADTPDEVLYGPWEYHWSSYGMAIGVSALIERLRSRGWPLSAPRLVRAGQRLEPQSLLSENYRLPQCFLQRRGELRRVEPLFRVIVDDVGRAPRRLVLAGTSFSAATRGLSIGWQLSSIFHRPVNDFAAPGGGYSRSFEKMRREGFAFEPGDLFIWELPVSSLHLDDRPPIGEIPIRSLPVPKKERKFTELAFPPPERSSRMPSRRSHSSIAPEDPARPPLASEF